MSDLDMTSTEVTRSETDARDRIESIDSDWLHHFKEKFLVEPALSRTLVSFQANKTSPSYRWYKFKEGFSAKLVEYLLLQYGIAGGTLLDPFAGSGTALFVARAMGMNADGIELLPIGQQIILTKKLFESEFTPEDRSSLVRWRQLRIWNQVEKGVNLAELRITKGAYPQETRAKIERYLTACQSENGRVQMILRFALLCVLESISYTRKDGQYLRWDSRSGHGSGKKDFNKGSILSFDEAICEKLDEILTDLSLCPEDNPFSHDMYPGEIHLLESSSLDVLPKLDEHSYDVIITSPPYCNRYDYTRTYALELALLGVDEKELTELRQEMLSCTVENRVKDLLRINPRWQTSLAIAEKQPLLQEILRYLEDQKAAGKLNNNGIARMVRGYFYELACVIFECSRVLKPGGLFFMVNDNVRYAGVSISVDMILSDFAEQLGFYIEKILVLPIGKGNSSQQMGVHGRESLRKCVYVWRKS